MKVPKLEKRDIAFWIIIIFVFIGVIFWVLSNVPLKVKVYKSIQGICWNPNDESKYYTTELKFDGYYCNYILENKKNDDYTMKVYIVGIEGTEDFDHVALRREGDPYPDPYTSIINVVAQYYDNERECVIRGRVDGGYRYAFPATNIDEAKALFEEIIESECENN